MTLIYIMLGPKYYKNVKKKEVKRIRDQALVNMGGTSAGRTKSLFALANITISPRAIGQRKTIKPQSIG